MEVFLESHFFLQESLCILYEVGKLILKIIHNVKIQQLTGMQSQFWQQLNMKYPVLFKEMLYFNSCESAWNYGHSCDSILLKYQFLTIYWQCVKYCQYFVRYTGAFITAVHTLFSQNSDYATFYSLVKVFNVPWKHWLKRLNLSIY